MNNLLIVIVIFNKRIENLPLFKNIISDSPQLEILIYDNSLNSHPPSIKSNNLHYIHDKFNGGVSKGYNIAISKAKNLRKKYILLLDQDTEFRLSDLTHYNKLERKYGELYIYAPIITSGIKIYSPFIDLNYVGKIQNKNNFQYKEQYLLDNKSIINSGMMIPIKIIDTIGGFNEKIKLDFSDIYFIEKYKKINQYIVLVDLWVKHSLSGDEGLDSKRELHRFKYYCTGAKEFSRALNKNTQWSVFRRMLRLVHKYKTLRPLITYFHYYIRDKVI